MALVDRHIAFLEALRGAGLPVSLAEDLDAVAALQRARPGTTARRSGRRTPRRWSSGSAPARPSTRSSTSTSRALVGEGAGALRGPPRRATRTAPGDDAAALPASRARARRGAGRGDRRPLRRLAVEAVGRFGAMPGRGPGLSAGRRTPPCTRVSPDDAGRRGSCRRCRARSAAGRRRRRARAAGRRVGAVRRRLVEDDARRRIAEEKGPDHVAHVAVRPSIDRLDFTSARSADLERDAPRDLPAGPAARHPADPASSTPGRRGPLDFRRTVRASISTGGVPLTTHHRPPRPHRTELVVLCDVSGSVASFAQFTLLLVFALREQFQQGARVHVRRPGARGHRLLRARAPTSPT